MKINPRRSRTACLLIGSVLAFASPNARTAAEEPASGRRAPMIEIEARFVRATPEQMADAVGKTSEGDPITTLKPEEFEKAITTLTDAKADFFSHSRTIVKSGRKAVIESVRELRYPSDYEPSKDDPTKFIPTAFETKDVGAVLEFEPTVAPRDAEALTIDLEATLVHFSGFVEAAVAEAGLEGKTDKERERLAKNAIPEGAKWTPLFTTKKLGSSQRLRSGQTWLWRAKQTGDAQDPTPGPIDFHIFITARLIAPK